LSGFLAVIDYKLGVLICSFFMMPKYRYALQKWGSKDLEISWRGKYIDLVIKYKWKEVWHFEDRSELDKWKEFDLGWGKLFLKLNKILWILSELQVLYDGKYVSGTSGDPETYLKSIFWLLFVLGWLNIVLWLIAELGSVEFLFGMWVGRVTVVFGIILWGLAWW